jgi:hypothetical protein
VNVLAVQAAREIDVRHEHVARVHALPLAWVGAAATATAEIARTIIAIAGIISPTSVVEHEARPSNDSVFRSRRRPTQAPIQSIAGPRNHLPVYFFSFSTIGGAISNLICLQTGRRFRDARGSQIGSACCSPTAVIHKKSIRALKIQCSPRRRYLDLS